MRVFPDFQDEILKLDPRLSVVANPNRDKIANIKINGTDICAIPNHEIREFSDPGYTIEMPNGTVMRHRSRPEALELVKHVLAKLENDKDYHDAFFGEGSYK